MLKVVFCVLATAILWFPEFDGMARGGQIVDEETRAWAKKAVAEEKALGDGESSRRLAVLYFDNTTEFSELDLVQKGLTLMLITDLSKVPHIELVERVKLQALVEELELSVSGLVGKKTAPRVGKLLGAGLLVGGKIVKEQDNMFRLQSDLLGVADERVLGTPSAKGMLVAELFRMEKDLLFEIVELLRIEMTPRLQERLKEPLSANLGALMDLFRGLHHADNQRYDKAAEALGDAVGKDPALIPAIGLMRDIYKERNRGFEPAIGPWRIPWIPTGTSGGGSDKPCAAERNKILRNLPRGF